MAKTKKGRPKGSVKYKNEKGEAIGVYEYRALQRKSKAKPIKVFQSSVNIPLAEYMRLREIELKVLKGQIK